MADPIGTPLAALATAEQCVKLAAKLRRKYIDYATAEQSLRELILVLEHRAVTIEHQVAFLQTVWSSLEERLQNLQNTLLHMLYHKLQYATELVDAAIGSKQERPSISNVLAKRGPVRKLYFAFSLKQCLQKTVDELEKWHKMFDPTWYLLCRISSSALSVSLQDHAEARSVSVLKRLRSAASQRQTQQVEACKWLQPELLANATTSELGFDIRMSRLRSGDTVIVDQFIPHKQASAQRTRDEIHKLSSTLANVDPQVFGLLQCCGVVSNAILDPSQVQQPYYMLFGIPPGVFKPSTLRAKLTRTTSISLNTRLSLAQSLSNAVMFVHSSQFVHKNIRPETILTFESASSNLPNTYLVGFEKFRLASGETFRAGDARWESNLYRHPRRQGLWPEEEYSMLHDVYSLGVVLLEVGLWTNLVVYTKANPAGNNNWSDGVRTTTATASLHPVLGPKVSPLNAYSNKPAAERARLTQSFLVDLARDHLPCTMGDKYAQIVVRCLTCLDTENPGLGDPDEFLDRDEVVVGVEFVESVIMGLHEISC